MDLTRMDARPLGVLLTAAARQGDGKDVLLVCKRFRDVLLGRALSVAVTRDSFSLLPLSPNLQALTLTDSCTRLPWSVERRGERDVVVPVELAYVTTSLTRLVLTHNDALSGNAVDLRSVGALSSLRILDVSGCRLDGTQHLASLSNLRSLDLSATSVQGGGPNGSFGLEHLSRLPLASLSLHDTKVAAPELRLLASLTALTRLNAFVATDFAPISVMGHVSGLTALESLQLYDAGLDSCCALQPLTRLTRLELLNAEFSFAGAGAIADLPRLRRLRLACNWRGGVVVLGRFGALEELEAAVMDGSDDVDSALLTHGATRLTRLALDFVPGGPPVTEDWLVQLRGLHALAVSNGSMLREACEAVGTLRSLRALRLRGCSIAPGSLSTLTTLTALEVDGCSADDPDDFEDVAALRTLQRLALVGGLFVDPATGAEVARPPPLCELQLVTSLRLELPHFGDADLAGVSMLTALRELDARARFLSGRAFTISAAGAACLSALTALTRLSLRPAAGVPASAVSALPPLHTVHVMCERAAVADVVDSLLAHGRALAVFSVQYDVTEDAGAQRLLHRELEAAAARHGFPFSAAVANLRGLERSAHQRCAAVFGREELVAPAKDDWIGHVVAPFWL